MRNSIVFVYGGFLLLCCCGGGVSAPPQPPNLQLSPASLNFGVQVVGTESTAQTETLTNTGGLDLDLSSIAINGANAADFTQGGICGSTLGSGATCTISVTFTPTQIGQRSASMTIADNGPESTQMLSLTGIGGTAGANATLSPSSVNFGNQKLGTTSAAQVVSLSNYGTATLDIADISASADFGETNNCQLTLASGASCIMNVTFTPGEAENVTGELQVADNASDNPQTVALSGTGIGACQAGGEPCYTGHPCCPGLECVFEGDRAKCVAAGFVLREP
jgi:Abnormal spindle-like microcephaly-assoc'd, ASPM-SPD-2-Hydin